MGIMRKNIESREKKMLSSCVKPDSRTRTTLGRCRFSIWLLPNPILALESCIFDETRFSLLYFANPLVQI